MHIRNGMWARRPLLCGDRPCRVSRARCEYTRAFFTSRYDRYPLNSSSDLDEMSEMSGSSPPTRAAGQCAPICTRNQATSMWITEHVDNCKGGGSYPERRAPFPSCTRAAAAYGVQGGSVRNDRCILGAAFVQRFSVLLRPPLTLKSFDASHAYVRLSQRQREWPVAILVPTPQPSGR